MSIDDRESTGQDTGQGTDRDAALREQARARIQRKRGFWTHFAIYVAMNAMFVLIWAWTGAPFFWPVIPLVLWGIGVGADAWDAFAGKSISEERMRREIDRMRRS
ncbi:2TM domain-containing protein [Pseudonocardia xishanensis]|uniref:2TM domain-containing protein n=1 Tax=Pseudonocardia xishanensis TaxID=630995 RepID=A0ABP8RSM2_9PSEU